MSKKKQEQTYRHREQTLADGRVWGWRMCEISEGKLNGANFHDKISHMEVTNSMEKIAYNTVPTWYDNRR